MILDQPLTIRPLESASCDDECEKVSAHLTNLTIEGPSGKGETSKLSAIREELTKYSGNSTITRHSLEASTDGAPIPECDGSLDHCVNCSTILKNNDIVHQSTADGACAHVKRFFEMDQLEPMLRNATINVILTVLDSLRGQAIRIGHEFAISSSQLKECYERHRHQYRRLYRIIYLSAFWCLDDEYLRRLMNFLLVIEDGIIESVMHSFHPVLARTTKLGGIMAGGETALHDMELMHIDFTLSESDVKAKVDAIMRKVNLCDPYTLLSKASIEIYHSCLTRAQLTKDALLELTSIISCISFFTSTLSSAIIIAEAASDAVPTDGEGNTDSSTESPKQQPDAPERIQPNRTHLYKKSESAMADFATEISHQLQVLESGVDGAYNVPKYVCNAIHALLQHQLPHILKNIIECRIVGDRESVMHSHLLEFIVNLTSGVIHDDHLKTHQIVATSSGR